MLSKMRRKWSSHTFLVVNITVTLKNSLTLSYKTKHTLTIRPNNHKLECYSKGNKNLCSYKNLYRNVYRSSIQMIKNWKQLKYPLGVSR